MPWCKKTAAMILSWAMIDCVRYPCTVLGIFECHAKMAGVFTVHAFHTVVPVRGVGNETDVRLIRFVKQVEICAHAERFELCV